MHAGTDRKAWLWRSCGGLLLAVATCTTIAAQTGSQRALEPSPQAPAQAAVPAAAPSPAAPVCQGLVYFQGLPVPGVTVTLTQAGKKLLTVTDMQGFYTFGDVASGPASLHLQMTGFAQLDQAVDVAVDAPLARSDLQLLTLEQMRAELKPVPGAPLSAVQARSELARTGEAPKPAAGQPASATPASATEDTSQRAAEGLLINGSVNNAATSQFTLAQRFGNTASGKSLYSGSLDLQIENSALDAKPYSIAGIDTSKPDSSEVTGGFAIQGPLRIPHLLHNGPNIFVGYQRTRDSTAVSTPGLVPTVAERAGDLSQVLNAAGQPVTVYNPSTGQPYTGAVPVSPQAAALLALYPLPNVAGNPLYNYEIPLQSTSHVDAVNSNASKTIGRNNQLTGTFAAASTRASFANLFSFTDATRTLGLNTTVNWAHTYNVHFRSNLGLQYSRQSTRLTPFWANRANISGLAGITGNDQDPAYWGPPTLNFSDGLSSLSDGNNSFRRNQTTGLIAIGRWNHAPHNITAGLEVRRQQFNYLTEQNPRGTFSFNGSATAHAAVANSGSDFADFLIGVPTASTVAFGNADKYLRANTAAAYITDDYRANAQLTVNAGVRWDFGSPASELKNRLVNLDVASGFANVAPLLASQPIGSLTGQVLPAALLHADLAGVQPRIGVSWRPLAGSSLLIAGGYGVNFDTSVYQGIAAQMSQQAPLSKSLTVQNSAACPLTLANGFHPCVTTTQDTFGVDPNFRVGYLHTWNLRVQRDLLGSLQMVATYLGNKGTRGVQEFLPNTDAPGAVASCASCPSGFIYLTATGNSTRESGQLQLRRRLKSGFTASVLDTYSKSIDDDSSLGGGGAATTGSASIAQDWRHLSGERGLSTFDQRHLANVLVQYTTGMGKGGGTLLSDGAGASTRSGPCRCS